MRMLSGTAIALVLLACPALAAERDVRSAIENVIVYPDGATVTRVIETDLSAGENTLLARDFPPGLDPSSLRIEGEGGARLAIGAIEARPPRAERPPLSPELENRIEALNDQRGVLDDKITAATARRKFAERFAEQSPAGIGEKGEARPLAEWRAAFTAIAEEVASADAIVRAAKVEQRDIDRELARLEAQRNANPPRKMEVRIDLVAAAATSAKMRVSYSVRGARWAPIYDARLDTSTRDRKPALELIRRAEIMQQTGEDWSDVALSVSTVRTAKGGSAPDLRPLIVGYPRPVQPLARPMPAAPANALRSMDGRLEQDALAKRDDEMRVAQKAAEREAILDAGGFQAVYQIPGHVSVATNEGAKSFRIATAKIDPKLIVRATPALDETGFLEANFVQTDEAPLLPGRVAVYRDGIYVGRSQLALTPKDETVRLGFGADEKVKITRTVVRKVEGSTGIISTAKTDEREFKITIRNGHDVPVAFTIEDQVPVSEADDIKVELLPVTTPPSERDIRDRRGVLAWNFDAAPGETREIKLGWRVRWPTDKAIAYEPRS
ncbi:MAG: mucoidy inhibitor MuiA family protein [Xanthobacteraceae bacterium]